MIRKIVKALVLIPITVTLLALAVANRQSVTVSFDPFDRTDPAFSLSMPLYGLVLVLTIGGVIIGGVAAWLGQRRWRGRARLAESQVRDLQAEFDRLKRGDRAAGEAGAPAVEHGQRLTIPPPPR